MDGILRHHFFRSAMVTIFIAVGFETCCGEECRVNSEARFTGPLEDEVVSLLHLNGRAHLRSGTAAPLAQTAAQKKAGKEITAEAKSISADAAKEKSRARAAQQKADQERKDAKKLRADALTHELRAHAKKTEADGEMSQVLAAVVVVMVLLLMAVFAAIGMVRCCSSEPPETKDGSSKCTGMNWFFWQYVNRLMLLLVAAFTLMTWLSFCRLIMPSDASTFGIWFLLLFTAGMWLVMTAYAWWYALLTTKIVEQTKRMGPKVGKEVEEVMKQSYGNITDVTGYVLVQVWLQVYPIPTNISFWWSLLVVLITVGISVLCEMLLLHYETSHPTTHRILGHVSSNVLSAGAWIIVAFWVLDLRKAAGVPALQPAPAYLGFASLLVSGIIMVVSQMLIACCLGVSEEEETEEAEGDQDKAKGFVGQKAVLLINMACLYTTGLLFFEAISQTYEYQHNSWCWSITFFLVAGFALVCLQLVMGTGLAECGASLGGQASKIQANVLSMTTNLLGWLSGKMLVGCFMLVLAGGSVYAWLPVGFIAQFLAIAVEQTRVLHVADHGKTDEKENDSPPVRRPSAAVSNER